MIFHDWLMHGVNSSAHDLDQLQIGHGGGGGRGPLKGNQIAIPRKGTIEIPVYVEPEGWFCFCLPEDQISFLEPIQNPVSL